MAKQKEMDMTKGPFLKNIIVFAIPLILTGILQQFYNAADLNVVGFFDGQVALAAVGSTGSLHNMIVGLFMGLSVGAGVCVAHHMGAREPEEVHHVVHTSLLLAAVRMPDGTYSSQLRRIYQSSNNLYRLEQFNGISRRICQEVPDFEEAQRWIAKAKRSKPYPDILVFLGSALAAGACSVFFEGSLRDGLAAALVGMIFAGLESVTAGRINRMAQTVLHSFVAGVLAYLSVTVGIGENIGAVMIGTIMLLIPGLELGNALRDLLGSDLLAGSLRIVQVCLVAIMIAFGYAAALLVMGGIFG